MKRLKRLRFGQIVIVLFEMVYGCFVFCLSIVAISKGLGIWTNWLGAIAGIWLFVLGVRDYTRYTDG